MNLSERSEAFILLGRFLEQFTHDPPLPVRSLDELNRLYFDRFVEALLRSTAENAWFTPSALREALQGIVLMLERETMEQWTAMYPELAYDPADPVNVGVVMAGNIPLVGFHDFLCVLLSGHRIMAKSSSRDRQLLPLCGEIVAHAEPRFRDRISFTEDRLLSPGAVIATGSNNSSRYFEYYFRSIPRIIRKNRNSAAVLGGEESPAQLEALGRDVFSFFGLGCRNVTKIWIPDGFPPEKLMEAFDGFAYLAGHNKYQNNVDYHRSVYLMNRIPFLDNGIVLLKEDLSLASPVGVVYYEKYTDIGRVNRQLEQQKDELQCVVSAVREIGGIAPGTAQTPMPWDYADGVDTIRFLIQLNRDVV
ncbi:MAG: acyl-CoA reductase [Bacteroidota bacterium]